MRPVGRPGRQPVLRAAPGRLVAASLVDERDEERGEAPRVRRVRDGAAVGRPGRRDVERAVDGDAPLVRAVVVGDVDLLDVAILDRVGDLLAVAIRGERQLRARDAAQRALLLVDLVGHRVRVGARVAGRARVFTREHRLPADDVEQAHLDLQARALLLHRADHQAVGAQLAPAIEGHVGHRAAPREWRRRCRAGSCRTRARSPGRPTAPGAMVAAAALVSLSPDSARKSGTAYFGGAPGAAADDQLHLALLRRAARRVAAPAGSGSPAASRSAATGRISRERGRRSISARIGK